jgi:hypothetical protein
MKCEDVELRLAEVVTASDALPPEIAEHVSTCPRCRTREGELRATVELVRTLAPEGEAAVAPPPFARVLDRTRSRARLAPRLLARAAALLLAVLAGAAADRAWLETHGARPETTPARSSTGGGVAAALRSREDVRRELAARPSDLGASLALLGGLEKK